MIQIPLRNLFNFEVPFSVGYDKDGRVSIESLFKCHQGFSPISRQQAHRRHHLRPDSNQPNYATFLVWGLALILARSSWNRGERQFSFPSIPKNESLWFPFPSFGNGFFHSLPIPEFRECFFSIHSRSRILGKVFFHSLPVPEFWEWFFFIPFPFPNCFLRLKKICISCPQLVKAVKFSTASTCYCCWYWLWETFYSVTFRNSNRIQFLKVVESFSRLESDSITFLQLVKAGKTLTLPPYQSP